ncbi:hypothetical protein MHH81_20995 [Psychrobacillus sp. FSL H8-0484]|uniref:hypothetical protein n=1 Tax=Psychrobacillus sp. FSL H8-0484 TaxID=2921390 RepID=UPI0030F58263
MQLEYDIGEGDTGTGFGNDFGFFPYDYTKPPELRTEHFSLQTDIQNEALILQERHNGKFAYRDNLHSAVSYQTKQNIPSVKFRPDGELIVGDNSFLIEADMSTERGLQLKDKFVGYKKYLDYLTSQKKSLPKGVIFVFTNRNERYNNRLIYLQGQQRFNSLFTLFREHLKDYEHTFRLICVELKDFQQRMELLLPGNKKVLYDRVTAHLKLDAPKQADISTTLDEGYPVALIKQNNEHTFYMLQEIEGYTNVPWINGFRIYKELLRKYPKLKVISYYSQNHSIPPISQGHINNIDNPELKNYYKAMNFLNAGGMDSVWFDYQHKVLDAAPF